MVAAAASDSIMASLKAATAELHSHAETRALQRAMAQGRLDRDTYTRYLAQLGGIHSALEDGLRTLASRTDALGDAARSIAGISRPHSPNIVRDLGSLGVSIPAEPLPATDRFLKTILCWGADQSAALLGCLYVLEGSMNGNKFLARSMARALGVSPAAGPTPPGLSYLDPYGDRQRDLWQAFRAAMDAAPFTPDQQRSLIDAATATFQAIADISDQAMNAATPA